MDLECRDRWAAVYSSLSADRPGLVGSVLNRAETQVLRLALVYTLADGANIVRTPHLTAALAVWRYCEDSARVIFGNALGDPIADEILRVLRETSEGMTRDELRNHFDRHVSAARLTQALTLLNEHRLARCVKEPPQGGKGRPAERWFADAAPCAESAVSAENAPDRGSYRANGAYRASGRDRGGAA